MNVDMNRPDRAFKTGVNRWRVYDAKETETKARDATMLELTYECVSDPSADRFMDRIVFKPSAWAIAKRRLTALGVPEDFSGEIPAASLIGRQVDICTEVDSESEYAKKFGDQLRVAAGELTHKGYRPVSGQPAWSAVTGTSEVRDDDDLAF